MRRQGPNIKSLALPISDTLAYPFEEEQRRVFLDASRKPVTEFKWRVFDCILKVPPGKVTSYKEVAQYLGSSPRAVGQALKMNPFAPFVPCHRVVSSNLFIGGFFGTWGKGPHIERKIQLLKEEGILFNEEETHVVVGVDQMHSFLQDS
eukprot:Sdes_comp16121_c0_seq1m5350